MRSLFLLAALAFGGCYKNTYTTGLPAGNSQTIKATFFLYGLIGEETVNLNQLCPNGVAWFQNRMDVPDALLSCITCSLYTPLTIEVRCAAGNAWLAVPDEQQQLTWVYPIDENDNIVEADGDPALFGNNTLNTDLNDVGGDL
jgi:hypothetical protein